MSRESSAVQGFSSQGVHWVTLIWTQAATTERREQKRDGSLGLANPSHYTGDVLNARFL